VTRIEGGEGVGLKCAMFLLVGKNRFVQDSIGS